MNGESGTAREPARPRAEPHHAENRLNGLLPTVNAVSVNATFVGDGRRAAGKGTVRSGSNPGPQV